MKFLAKLLPVALVLLPLSAGAVSIYGDASTDVNAGSNVSGSAHTNTTVQVGGSGPVNSQKPDDNSGAQIDVTVGANGTTTVLTTPNGHEVDFDSSVKTIKDNDDRVAAADVDGDGAVEVEFKHHAHLFGFIPVILNSHTTVSSDGVVKVSLPWWSFLVSDASDIRAGIESSLNANAEVEANASANADSSSRVKLVEVMVSSLAEVEAAMKASYDLKAAKK